MTDPMLPPDSAKDCEITPDASEFAELAFQLAMRGGGTIPLEVSENLALDLVLNQIVEDACRATGASGAAVALTRGDEIVCRACTGENAPELGTRIDTDSGLSGACVRSRQVQSCEDALTDERVDAEASQRLGVRSIVVLPLLQGEELIGVFEVFSSLPGAFGYHDLLTLESLAERIVENAKARQSSPRSVGPSDAGLPAVPLPADGLAEEQKSVSPELAGTDISVRAESEVLFDVKAAQAVRDAGPRFDWLTTVMSAIVLAVAVSMTTVISLHMGWLRTNAARRVDHRAATVLPGAAASTEQPNTSADSAQSIAPANLPPKSTTTAESGKARARTAEGSLRVFQDGKEIFRMPASEMATTNAMKPAGQVTNGDSILQPAKIVELSPDAAEGNIVQRAEPEYPEQALAQRVQGSVLLEVHINKEGAVQDVKLLSGPPLLAEAAVEAVRRWRFRPQRVKGQPVEMETRITLKFTLPSS